MSWNLFHRKKSTSRENREFETGVERMKCLDDSTRHLNKEIKKMIANANLYGRSVSKLNQDLMELNDEGCQINSLKDFDSSVVKQEQIIRDMITGFDQTLSAPMKKYSTIFPHFEEMVKKREKCLLELSKLTDKLQKHEDQRKISNTLKIEQLKREITPMKEEYDQINSGIVDEVSRFYNNRLDYLYPSFNALVNIQRLCLNETLKSVEENDEGNNEEDDDEKTIEGILEEIRTLCITSD